MDSSKGSSRRYSVAKRAASSGSPASRGGLGLLGQPAQILLVELLPGAVQPLIEGEGVLDGEALEEGAAVGGENPPAG